MWGSLLMIAVAIVVFALIYAGVKALMQQRTPRDRELQRDPSSRPHADIGVPSPR
jgi:hypothetical protein